MTISAKSLVAKWKKDPAFKAGYDALGPEFEFVAALMAARKEARLSQTEIAVRMETKQSAVARLESGKSNPLDVVVGVALVAFTEKAAKDHTRV